MRTSVVVGLLGLVLGCGGLVGFGEERARQPVVSGQPFTFTYTPATAEPHNLWFDVDLQATGDYRATGTIQANGETWPVDIGPDGGPIDGGRLTYMWSDSDVLGKTKASGNLKGTSIPGSAAGTPVTVTGTLTFDANTTGALAIVVTD